MRGAGVSVFVMFAPLALKCYILILVQNDVCLFLFYLQVCFHNLLWFSNIFLYNIIFCSVYFCCSVFLCISHVLFP